MKNCKNIIIAAIAAILSLSLAGCSGNENSRTEITPEMHDLMSDYYANESKSSASVSTPAASNTTSTIETPASSFKPASSSKPAASSSKSATSSDKQPVVYYSKPASSKPTTSSDKQPVVYYSKPASSKPAASSSKPASSSKSASSSKPVVYYSKPASSSKPNVSYDKDNSVEAIAKICGLKSTVEKSESACWVDVFDEHNPYDVEYDYGSAYDKYIDKCDWSLVFDADYYIKQFPLLAMQYHNDKALLLEHFQTVGIHEGKQGSAKFNVGAYKANCDSKIRNAFGDNYEGYYFYYMMNPSEKSVNTTSGSNLKKQYKSVMTALQSNELKGINKYRSEVNVAPVAFNSELAAYANFRAWTNVHDGWEVHDWVDANLETVYFACDQFNSEYMGENVCQNDSYQPFGQTHHVCYRNSPPHYQGMTKAVSDTSGTSNSFTRNRDYGKTYSCDTFVNIP